MRGLARSVLGGVLAGYRGLAAAAAPRTDVAIVGGGHNGLVAALLLARQGLQVSLFEEKPLVGGACRTEYPFAKVPGLGHSSGAYLLGVMPPELIKALRLDIPTLRRDPHYFLPTTGDRYLLFGSDAEAMKGQFLKFFSQADWDANQALQAEITAICDDVAPAWLKEPLTLEETAERYVRPALRGAFLELCRRPVRDYVEKFGFKSDLLKVMFAVTDGFSGLNGGWDTPGTGLNFLAHNMCRLPGSDGTWMVVKGGMGTVTQRLAEAAIAEGVQIHTATKVAGIEVEGGAARGVLLEDGRRVAANAVVGGCDPFRLRDLAGAGAFPQSFNSRLDSMRRDGTTMKVDC